MKNKIALITGITGQDGSYLAELLLNKGYIVHGLKRCASTPNTDRIDEIYKKYNASGQLFLHISDITDSANIIRLISEITPSEIYNLAAQSHVGYSFDIPEYTANTDAIGPLRMLEAIRILKLTNHTKFYQASTSELFGNATTSPQSETTIFAPRSPYAIAKLYAYWITRNYREAYNIHASNGILFNHESPLRGEIFVSRKITKAIAAIVNGKQNNLVLGNLDSKRDWGHASDFVHAMWQILQHDTADDYVIATGINHSVREFVEVAFKVVNIPIVWHGRGIKEKGFDGNTGKLLITVDPKLFRPTEVDELLGDASKAKVKLGWHAKVTFQELVTEMMESDLKEYNQAENIGPRRNCVAQLY